MPRHRKALWIGVRVQEVNGQLLLQLLLFTGCVIVGKLLNLSELQFLQLYNGDDDDNSAYLTEL